LFERKIDHQNQDRYFDEWTNHSGKSSPGVDSKYGDGHSNAQLKIVSGSGESQRGRLGVLGTPLPKRSTASETDPETKAGVVG